MGLLVDFVDGKRIRLEDGQYLRTDSDGKYHRLLVVNEQFIHARDDATWKTHVFSTPDFLEQYQADHYRREAYRPTHSWV